jgi:hypothetical protein
MKNKKSVNIKKKSTFSKKENQRYNEEEWYLIFYFI